MMLGQSKMVMLVMVTEILQILEPREQHQFVTMVPIIVTCTREMEIVILVPIWWREAWCNPCILRKTLQLLDEIYTEEHLRSQNSGGLCTWKKTLLVDPFSMWGPPTV